MKIKFLLPVVAMIFAIGGAFAANKMVPTFYQNDDQCDTEPVVQPCTIGTNFQCIKSGNTYYWKPNASDPVSECRQLLTDEEPEGK